MNENEMMRLQKYLSSCGVSSRRGSEKIITSGRVKVNGAVVTQLGTKVDSSDIVEVDGEKVTVSTKKYIVINKPEGFVCTRNDEMGRKTVFDLLGKNDDPSIFHVGRLDMESSGLLILTNDGEFANNIIHPSKSVIKGYNVTSDRIIDKLLIDNFNKGIEIDGVFYKAVKCIANRDGKSVSIELKEGKKREIRVVFKHFSQNVTKLERVFIGFMRLYDICLKPGEYKEFSYDDLYRKIYIKE